MSLLGRARLREKVEAMPSHAYLIARTISIFAGSALALYYTRLLGPANRGVITFVMLSSLLASELGLGGLNLAFRARGGSLDHDGVQEQPFRRASLLGAIFLTGVVFASLLGYSHFKEVIPPHLLVMSTLYVFMGIATHQLFEYFLAFRRLVLSAYVEIVAIGGQVTYYFLLDSLTPLSTAVIVMLSLSAGYATVWALLPLVANVRGRVTTTTSQKSSPSILALNTRRLTPQVVTISLIDRLDKLMVAIFFSSATFGKYGLATALIVVFRFLPDSIGKLLVASRFQRIRKITKQHSYLLGSIFLLTVPILAYANSLFITEVIGKEWKIGLGVISAVIIAEALRHILVLKLNLQISQGISQLRWTTPIGILLAFLVGSSLLKGPLGLISVPFTACICFTFLLLFGMRKTGQELH